jgi:hypothetical protein
MMQIACVEWLRSVRAYLLQTTASIAECTTEGIPWWDAVIDTVNTLTKFASSVRWTRLHVLQQVHSHMCLSRCVFWVCLLCLQKPSRSRFSSLSRSTRQGFMRDMLLIDSIARLQFTLLDSMDTHAHEHAHAQSVSQHVLTSDAAYVCFKALKCCLDGNRDNELFFAKHWMHATLMRATSTAATSVRPRIDLSYHTITVGVFGRCGLF